MRVFGIDSYSEINGKYCKLRWKLLRSNMLQNILADEHIRVEEKMIPEATQLTCRKLIVICPSLKTSSNY